MEKSTNHYENWGALDYMRVIDFTDAAIGALNVKTGRFEKRVWTENKNADHFPEVKIDLIDKILVAQRIADDFARAIKDASTKFVGNLSPEKITGLSARPEAFNREFHESEAFARNFNLASMRLKDLSKGNPADLNFLTKVFVAIHGQNATAEKKDGIYAHITNSSHSKDGDNKDIAYLDVAYGTSSGVKLVKAILSKGMEINEADLMRAMSGLTLLDWKNAQKEIIKAVPAKIENGDRVKQTRRQSHSLS